MIIERAGCELWKAAVMMIISSTQVVRM